MKIFFSCLLVFSITISAFAQENLIGKQPDVITGQLVKVIPSLRNYNPVPLNNNIKVRDLEGIIGKDEEFEEGEGAPDFGSSTRGDGALQKVNGYHTVNNALINSFAGI